MASLKFFFLVALAIACVFADETERAKKDVLVGGAYPYGAYSGLYSGAYVPSAYSAGYAAAAYPAGYAAAAYPTAYSAYPYAGIRSYVY